MNKDQADEVPTIHEAFPTPGALQYCWDMYIDVPLQTFIPSAGEHAIVVRNFESVIPGAIKNLILLKFLADSAQCIPVK